MENLKQTSAFKMVLLLNFLARGKYSKEELIDEFSKFAISVNKANITNYIKKIISCNFNIEEFSEKKIRKYCFRENKPELDVSDENLKIFSKVKQLIFSQGRYDIIKYFVEVFYKLSIYVKDEDTRREFSDFDYFSKVNWGLIRALEYHCKTKDIVILDYLLPKGGNKLLWFHLDKIVLDNLSKRLYLYGMLENGYDFSKLPVERIFTIQKVLKRYVPFDFKTEVIEYKISKSAYENTVLEKIETVIKKDEKTVTIQTPVINEFHLVQKLLNYCPDLYYISEGRIKELVKEKLKLIRGIYA